MKNWRALWTRSFPPFLASLLRLFSFYFLKCDNQSQLKPNIIPHILYSITFSPPGPPNLPHLCQWQAKVETRFSFDVNQLIVTTAFIMKLTNTATLLIFTVRVVHRPTDLIWIRKFIFGFLLCCMRCKKPKQDNYFILQTSILWSSRPFWRRVTHLCEVSLFSFFALLEKYTSDFDDWLSKYIWFFTF